MTVVKAQSPASASEAAPSEIMLAGTADPHVSANDSITNG
jgi:hypothetical protein